MSRTVEMAAGVSNVCIVLSPSSVAALLAQPFLMLETLRCVQILGNYFVAQNRYLCSSDWVIHCNGFAW
jgi:hypothetical protein